jgi:hypothetical protein
MKVNFSYFWSGFNSKENFLTNIFKNDANFVLHDDFLSCDVSIVGCFIDSNDVEIITSSKCKKILFITEPLGIHLPVAYELYKKNIFHKVFGCVENGLNEIKYPLYMLYFNYNDENIFKTVNEYVKETNMNEKRFSCLVNKHDNNFTRTKIFEELVKIDKVWCPSSFKNNCTNEEINKLGNVNYFKLFKFNICPENSYPPIKGYITEKLLNCCLGCAIPVYSGYLDEIDLKIFNVSRIILFDHLKDQSIMEAAKKVEELINNKEFFEEFYKQDVFLETAYRTCLQMEENLKNNLLLNL